MLYYVLSSLVINKLWDSGKNLAALEDINMSLLGSTVCRHLLAFELSPNAPFAHSASRVIGFCLFCYIVSSRSSSQVTSLRDLDCTFYQRLSMDHHNENPIYISLLLGRAGLKSLL